MGMGEQPLSPSPNCGGQGPEAEAEQAERWGPAPPILPCPVLCREQPERMHAQARALPLLPGTPSWSRPTPTAPLAGHLQTTRLQTHQVRIVSWEQRPPNPARRGWAP